MHFIFDSDKEKRRKQRMRDNDMAKSEFVIKISEETYKATCNGRIFPSDLEDVVIAIKNSTPIDLEGLKSDMKALNCGYPYGLDYLLDCLDKRLGITITGADKGEDEET